MDDRPRQDAPPPGPEWFLTKDRAKRFVFRLEQVRQERATYYRSEAIGMRSFAEAVPVLLALEEDMVRTVEDVLAGRLRDRERGETEIPFVAALEGVLERTRRARLLEDARRRHRAPPTEAPARILARGGPIAKALLVAFLGRGFAAAAARRGFQTNAGFAGFSAFDAKADFAAAFDGYLSRPGPRHLVMCHPGRVDAELAALDPVTAARETELAFLLSPRFPALLARRGATLAPLIRLLEGPAA